MTNAEQFKKTFGIYAEEFWSYTEKQMLDWINTDVPDINVGDTISRQAAIDAILEDKICDNSLKIMTAIGGGDKAETLNMTCDRHAKMLMGLPPAQPEQRWIPCGKCIHADGKHRRCKILDRSINEDYFCCWAEPYREEGGK